MSLTREELERLERIKAGTEPMPQIGPRNPDQFEAEARELLEKRATLLALEMVGALIRNNVNGINPRSGADEAERVALVALRKERARGIRQAISYVRKHEDNGAAWILSALHEQADELERGT